MLDTGDCTSDMYVLITDIYGSNQRAYGELSPYIWSEKFGYTYTAMYIYIYLVYIYIVFY